MKDAHSSTQLNPAAMVRTGTESQPASENTGHLCCDYQHGHGHTHVVKPVDNELLRQPSDTRAIYRIQNMDCPMEEALIRKKLASVDGVKSLEFNLMQRILTVDHAPGVREAIEKALKEIDMAPEALADTDAAKELVPQTVIHWKKLAWSGLFAILSEIFELISTWNIRSLGLDWSALTVGGFELSEILALILAVLAIFMSGLGTFKKGWLAVSNLNLNINALMSVAVTGAVLIGQFPEAAMVMVLFNISEAIEARSLNRARNAISELMSLAPDKAIILQPDGTWQEMDIANVAIGRICRVRPGQKIALDGEVTSGESTVNQAPITGESMPVEKKSGSPVYAGTINESGSFDFQVTATANNTTLARIIHTIEDAQKSRAPMQRFVDVFAKYYTPAVFILAILWAFLPHFLFSTPWHESIYTALVILVIGCPCALVISTPVTVVSALAAATRKGILVKGGLYMEQGRLLNWLALDKTGTITYGEPRLTDFVSLGGIPVEQVKIIAASLAARSDHPVSMAISESLKQQKTPLSEAADFTAIPGRGISGVVHGKKWFLGNHALVESLGLCAPALEDQFPALEKQGKTVVALVGEKEALALFAVADTVRQSSVEAISDLKNLNVNVLMLTGDNGHTAAAIARQLGIKDFKANLLPGQKLEVIEELEKDGNVVGMAGDGINDAPALARANIGFAMAKGGTDTAIETADVALMDDDLRKIPRFIRLSKATYAILVENIILALGIKAIFFGLTLADQATMWMAVFADVGAALLVVANGLRVLHK